MRFTRANIFSTVMFLASILIVIGTLMFTVNIKVLRDWRIVLPKEDIHAGQEIIIQSLYTKLKPVSGTAHRYLECKNPTGAFIRYELNSRTADNAPGTGGTGIPLVMPSDIPNLPTECRISINIDYKVYPWRTVTEYNHSDEFMLYPSVSKASIENLIRGPELTSTGELIDSSSPNVTPN